MSRLSRRYKIFLAFVGIVLGGYLVGRFGFSSGAASTEFKDARFQGAIIAQDIVNLSNQMDGDLAKVNGLDQQNKFRDAFDLTSQLLEKSQDLKKRAIDLSAQLEKMTGALITIDSSDARQAALESISSRLALIGRLLSYSDYLTQLLTTLRDHFSGIRSDTQVATLISQINSEVAAINNFNRQAGEAMDRFDRIVK